MDKAAREPYEQMAKEDKIRMKSMPPEDRPQRPQRQYDILTAQGVPYSVVERERNEKLAKEESAKLRIRQLIENEFDLDSEYRCGLAVSALSMRRHWRASMNLVLFLQFLLHRGSHQGAAILLHLRGAFLLHIGSAAGFHSGRVGREQLQFREWPHP